MADGNESGGQCGSRFVLGDVTNRIGKRGFSGREKDGVKRVCVTPHPCSKISSFGGNVTSTLSKIPSENRDSNSYDDQDGVHCLNGKHNVIGNSKFHAGCDKGKILDYRGENVVSQSVNELDGVDINGSGEKYGHTELSMYGLPKVDEVAGQNRVDHITENLEGGKVLNDDCSQLDLIKESKIPGAAEVMNENKCSGLDLGMFGTIHSVNSEANNELGDSSHADTSRTVSETGNDFLHDGQDCDIAEEIISHEGTQSDTYDHHNDLDDHNAGNFVLSQSGSVDCAFLPQSQESRVFGMDKSTEHKEEECAHMIVGTNAIKECSCSFCTKAAYIWLDLHQKDINARLSALKKSQKDASVLAERSCRMKVNETHIAERINRVSKMESHLMHQWRSLFHHMADIWEAESNQLEASLLPLINLRDKCKAEMESINAKQLEKH